MAAAPDPGRATRFPRGHCGRLGCRCTHTEGCDHGWLTGQPYSHRGVTYTAPAEPCPICRPQAVERMLSGSTTPPPERTPAPNPEPLHTADLPPELWADGEWT